MDDTTVDVGKLLDRLRAREPGAAADLIARAHHRIRLLAAKLLNESFPGVARVSEADSVVNATYQSLAKALESVELPTPADFFRFAAHKVRQTLLDMVADLKRQPAGFTLPGSDSSDGPALDPAADSSSISRKAMWAELHERVAQLPDDVRAVFEQCHYLGLSQTEVAAALGEHPRQVSRLWFKATILLKKYIPDGS